MTQGAWGMGGFCNEVQADKSAFAICEYIKDNYGVTKEGLDTGLPHVKHDSDGKSAELVWEEPNGKLEPAEVYKKAITLAELEEDENRKNFLSLNGKTDSFEFKSPLLDFLSKRGDMSIAWLFDDSNPKTSTDKKAFVAVNTAIKDICTELKKKIGGKTGSKEYQKTLANALFEYIKRPKAEGGLGVVFDSDAVDPEKNVVQTIEAGKATCTEFTKLYISLARQAGLVAMPVEEYKDAAGNYFDHLRVCVILLDGEELFFDLSPFFQLNKDDKWSLISKQDLLSYDYNNKSVSNDADVVERKKSGKVKSFLERALEFSPYQYGVLNTYGACLANGGDIAKAIPYFKMAASENPDSPKVYRNLALGYFLIGMESYAAKYCSAYKVLTGEESCKGQ